MEDAPTGRWLTVADIAEALHIHEQTVRRWIRDQHLPAIALGSKSGFRVWSGDLDLFLEEKSTAPGKVAA
jgi:excisionase family DNA binding protein